jgi:exodeoxyribonuclease V gamma subunit
MRSIPFPVIALIGMNHDAFPREDRPPAFDRMERFPRRGDRSRRTDDRYLFLEALLSTRRRFYISYVGQSIRDNSEIPPAVPVSELIDTLQRDCGIDAEAIVRKHPLQAFSPRYFNGADPRLFSYASENCVARGGDRGHPPAFFTATLPEPSEDFNQIGLSELFRFFANPCRFLLRHRLGIRLEAPDTVPDDRENFQLSPLDLYRLGNSLTAQYLEGLDADFAYSLHRADGRLPLGTVGRYRFGEIQSEAAALVRRVAAVTHAASGEQVEWQGTFSGVTVSGRLRDLYERGRVQFRFSPLRAPDLLSAWIQHLALGLAPDRPCPPETFLIGKDRGLYFRPVEDPGRYLGELLSIYREGIRQPLPFFPDLSLECVKSLEERGQEPAFVRRQARKRWEGGPYRRGVGDDAYIGLCFRQTDPFDDRFLKLATKIFVPLLRRVEALITEE